MNPLTNIVEPQSLLLTWQPSDEQAQSRTRRVVGEIVSNANGHIVFRYLNGTIDFAAAMQTGFRGFPAFRDEKQEFHQGVLEVFIRRLPPRNREDFDDFLAQHRLPSPFEYSDMALLAYTGARLPSDGFSLVPVFRKDQVPCDYLMEVAGLRHVFQGDVARDIAVGDQLSFVIEEGNPVDQNAILVVCRNQNIGYVNRAMRDTFHYWLTHCNIRATVERINGKPERPLVYVRISVS